MKAVQGTEDLKKAPAPSVVAPRPAAGTGRPKLLGRLRETLRPRRYRRCTEQAHCRWIKAIHERDLADGSRCSQDGKPGGPIFRDARVVFLRREKAERPSGLSVEIPRPHPE
jgi:hypothetical protein